MSMFSGRIGQPEGAFTRLSNKQAESALEFIIKNELEIREVIAAGTGASPSAVVGSDGTLISGNGITSSARSGLGEYTATLTTPGASANDLHPVATPMEVNGQAGGGAYKAYSGNAAALTDNTSNLQYYYSAADGKCYALGPNNDNIFIHDTADWTATAVEEDPGTDLIRVAGQSGCLDEDGDIVYLSGDSTGSVPIRAYTISTDTHTDFGTATDSICIGSRDGYLICMEPSTTVAYQPNFGTPAIGSTVQSWAISVYNSIDNTLAWDVDGWGWTVNGTKLYAFNPTSATYRTHDFPHELDQFTGSTSTQISNFYSPPIYDANRRAVYISLYDGAASHSPGIFRYSNWDNDLANNSGTWKRLTTDEDLAFGFESLAYDSSNDLLYGVSSGGKIVRRYRAHDGYRIDDVSIEDQTSPDNPQVDYNAGQSRRCFAVDGSVYVQCSKGGNTYIVRIDYDGAEIGSGGGGSAEIESVLVVHTAAISTTQVGVKIYRVSGLGFVRADAQFALHVGYK